jgi:hypothetical protein
MVNSMQAAKIENVLPELLTDVYCKYGAQLKDSEGAASLERARNVNITFLTLFFP